MDEGISARMPMNPIRVHLGPMPEMLRAIIGDLLAAEPDVEIVGIGDHENPSLAAARANGANILLSTLPSDTNDPSLAAVVEAQPLTVLALTPDGKACMAITLNRRELPFGGDSMAGLLKAIREGHNSEA